jgi:hypothetical protein
MPVANPRTPLAAGGGSAAVPPLLYWFPQIPLCFSVLIAIPNKALSMAMASVKEIETIDRGSVKGAGGLGLLYIGNQFLFCENNGWAMAQFAPN